MGVFILLWLGCGIAAGVVASGKGRGGCLWFCIGFIFGPIGLIMALVMSEDQKAVEHQAIAEGGMKKCPYCAELIRREARRCRYCGSDMPEQAAPDGPEDSQASSARDTCPECGGAYAQSDYRDDVATILCPHCKARIPRA